MIRLLLIGMVGTAIAAGGGEMATGGSAVWPTVLLCIILLMCSAFFSSAETALFGLQPVDVEGMSGDTENSSCSRPSHRELMLDTLALPWRMAKQAHKLMTSFTSILSFSAN